VEKKGGGRFPQGKRRETAAVSKSIVQKQSHAGGVQAKRNGKKHNPASRGNLREQN